MIANLVSGPLGILRMTREGSVIVSSDIIISNEANS